MKCILFWIAVQLVGLKLQLNLSLVNRFGTHLRVDLLFSNASRMLQEWNFQPHRRSVFELVRRQDSVASRGFAWHSNPVLTETDRKTSNGMNIDCRLVIRDAKEHVCLAVRENHRWLEGYEWEVFAKPQLSTEWLQRTGNPALTDLPISGYV